MLRMNQAEVKQVERNGREYLVFPVVVAREMVLDYPENGTRELLPAKHLSESVPLWSGTPISFVHPENEGRTVEDPIEYTSNVIGQGHEPELVDDDKLRVQAWVDVEKARAIGGMAEDVIEKLRNGEDLSVSAGYATIDDDPTGGTFEGEQYDIEQGHIIPDHIAIFPSDEFIARCTWEDGCGAPRLNAMQSSGYSSQAVNAGEVSMVAQEGHRVSWEDEGRAEYGIVVDTIPDGEQYDGVIDDATGPVPGPAALIEKYKARDDTYVATGRMVAVRMEVLTVIEDFPRPARLNTAPLPMDQSYCTAGPCQCGMHDPRVNALSEARTPEFDGLTSASWDPPSFTAYVTEWYERQNQEVPDDVQMDTVNQDAVSFAAARTLVGDPDADSVEEVVSFPVVNLDDELNENALTAARNLAHNSDAQSSIMDVTATLLERFSSGDQTWPSGNTYDFSDDNNTNAMSQNDEDPLAALGRRVLNALVGGNAEGTTNAAAAGEVDDFLDADESDTDDGSTESESSPEGEDSVDSEAESGGSDEPTDDDTSAGEESTDESTPDEGDEESTDSTPGEETDEESTEETTEPDDGDTSDDTDTNNDTMPDVLSIEEMAAKSAFGVQTLQDWDEEELLALEQTILENNPELKPDSEQTGESGGGEGSESTSGGGEESMPPEGSRENTEGESNESTDDKQNASDHVTQDQFNELKSMVEDIANQKENAEKTRKARQVANAVDGMSEDAAKELPEDTLDELYESHANTVNMAGVPGPAQRQVEATSGEDADDYPAGGRTNYEQRQAEGGD